MVPTSHERRRAFRRGHLAETAAAWLLRCKGYRIVARRVRTPERLDLLTLLTLWTALGMQAPALPT